MKFKRMEPKTIDSEPMISGLRRLILIVRGRQDLEYENIKTN
jgi:hypothetical protein